MKAPLSIVACLSCLFSSPLLSQAGEVPPEVQQLALEDFPRGAVLGVYGPTGVENFQPVDGEFVVDGSPGSSGIRVEAGFLTGGTPGTPGVPCSGTPGTPGPGINRAVAFDTSFFLSPVDDDLGSPNILCPGCPPGGISAQCPGADGDGIPELGGAPPSPFQNCEPLFNVVVVQDLSTPNSDFADGMVATPNDSGSDGAYITFDFTNIDGAPGTGSVGVFGFRLLDVGPEVTEEACVRFFADSAQQNEIVIPGVAPSGLLNVGDNGVFVQELRGVPQVAVIRLELDGSGAIDNLFFIAGELVAVGNRVWDDSLNPNGIQDPGEPGIPGVRVRLFNRTADEPILLCGGAQCFPFDRVTDQNGYYLFEALPQGDYTVRLLQENFEAGGALEAYRNTLLSGPDPDNDVDLDSNGLEACGGAGQSVAPVCTNGIVSGPVGLDPQLEPVNEGDLGPGVHGHVSNASSNLTIDFGVVQGEPPPEFDLALRKSDAQPQIFCPLGGGPLPAGVTRQFTITLFNQGAEPATDIQLIDYVNVPHPSLIPSPPLPHFEPFDPTDNPPGTTGGGVALPYSWAANGANGIATILGTLPPGGSLTLPVTLTVAPTVCPAGGVLDNYAEIFDDGSTIPDRDSQPESVEMDGNTDVLVDDEIFNAGGDEDDHDIGRVVIVPGAGGTFDLALRKTPNATLVLLGQAVTFTIEVFNQGTLAATDIGLIDYVDVPHPDIPLSFDQWEPFAVADNPPGVTGGDVALSYAWDATARVAISGTLLPGQSLTLPVTLTVAPDVPPGSQLYNFAEIELDNSGQTPDIDSQPEGVEMDGNTDVLVDDEIFNAGGDEDDHDVALVAVPGFLYTIPVLGGAGIGALILLLASSGLGLLRRRRGSDVSS